MNTKSRSSIFWLIFSLALIVLVSVASQLNYLFHDKSTFHVSSVASSTIYYIKLQLERFRHFDFLPQYWSNRFYTSGPVHTGLGFYNPLLLLPAVFSKFAQALIAYDILLKSIAGSGMFFLLRRLGFSSVSSLASGLIFTMNPFFSSFGADPQFIGAISCLPWILFTLESLSGPAGFLTVSFLLALAYLCSNIQSFTFLCAFVIFPYSALRGGQRLRGAALALGLTVILIAFELAPTLEVLKSGNRAVAGTDLARIVLYALLLVAASRVYQYASGSSRKKLAGLAILFAGACVILAEGGRSLFNLAYANYAQSRQETHFVFNEYLIRYVTLPQIILFLYALARRKYPSPGAGILIYLSVGYFLLNFFVRQEAFGLSRYFYNIYPSDYIRYSFVPLIGLLCGVSSGLDRLLERIPRYGFKPAAFLAVGLLCIDNSAVFLNRTLFTAGLSYLDREAPEYEFLKKLPVLDRVEAVYDQEHRRWKTSFYPQVLPKWLIPVYFGANTFSRVGIGIIPLHSFRYNALALPAYFGVDAEHPLNPLFNLAGVKYIYSYNRLPDSSGLTLLFKGEEYFVYRNDSAMPRVFLVPAVKPVNKEKALDALRGIPEKDFYQIALVTGSGDLGLGSGKESTVLSCGKDDFASSLGRVKVTRYDNEAVDFDCRVTKDCMLVFTDTYSEGWKAYIGKEAKKIERADYCFRGVRLSAGSYRLSMRYRPAVNFWAGLVSLTGWVAGIGYLGWFLNRKKHGRN